MQQPMEVAVVVDPRGGGGGLRGGSLHRGDGSGGEHHKFGFGDTRAHAAAVPFSFSRGPSGQWWLLVFFFGAVGTKKKRPRHTHTHGESTSDAGGSVACGACSQETQDVPCPHRHRGRGVRDGPYEDLPRPGIGVGRAPGIPTGSSVTTTGARVRSGPNGSTTWPRSSTPAGSTSSPRSCVR